MHQKIGRKKKNIYFYLIILIFFGSINNQNLNKFISKNKLIFDVRGLSLNENKKLKLELDELNIDNIFIFEKKKISNIILNHNYVLNFKVKKEYPDKINIEIQKAKNIGKVLKNNKFLTILSNGKTTKYISETSFNLPIFYGNFNTEEFLNFLEILNSVNLNTTEINSFYFFQSKRWDINFKNGIIVKLPQLETKDALKNALKISSDEKFKGIKTMDFRIKDKVVLDGK